MTRDPSPPRLIAGPYLPPRGRAYRPGRTVGDVLRGEVAVCGLPYSPPADTLADLRAAQAWLMRVQHEIHLDDVANDR